MNKKFNGSYTGVRKDLLALVPLSAKNVLDIGCSTGALSEGIKERNGAKVTGIEVSREMAAIAKKSLDRVIIGDIEKPTVFSKLKGQKFDVIVLGDVLEHLRDPWSILKGLYGLLTPKGLIIASVPNVRHMDSILNLLFKGYWPYRERGIHDKTHLRFFTKKNIIEMFKNAGYIIEKMEAHYRVIENPHLVNQYAKFLAFPIVKDFLAFQYLIVGRKK